MFPQGGRVEGRDIILCFEAYEVMVVRMIGIDRINWGEINEDLGGLLKHLFT